MGTLVIPSREDGQESPADNDRASKGTRQPAIPNRSFQTVLSTLIVLLVAACGLRAPINQVVTIEPDDTAQHITITATTQLYNDQQSGAIAERLKGERAAILDGRDEWSSRFASVNSEWDRTVFLKTRGLLERAEHTASIRADDMQRFFSDTGLTIQLTRAEGWTELAIYPGASSRATRQQRERVEQLLTAFAEHGARYYKALASLYAYLDREPRQAEAVFTILLSGGDQKSVKEEEQALIDEVDRAIDTIMKRLDRAQSEATTVDEDFDLAYNPLPAEIVVKLPRAATAIEGFEKRTADQVVIHRATLFEAVTALEGRWVAPDPLALYIRADRAGKDIPDPATMAAMPRSANIPTASEIRSGFLRQLQPAAAYRVRWPTP